MEENEVRILKAETLDGVVHNHLTTIDGLREQNQEKDETIKRQRQEILELKKPKSTRFWVKVYKDTDLSCLSFRDRGILFSLCQLVGQNKGGYLEDKTTGGLIETWSQLGRNIGIKDDAHTRNACKKLEENGILVVEHLRNGSIEDNDFFEHYFRRDKRRAAVLVEKRHFRIDNQYCSIGREKGNV